jgi:hypothetical protein
MPENKNHEEIYRCIKSFESSTDYFYREGREITADAYNNLLDSEKFNFIFAPSKKWLDELIKPLQDRIENIENYLEKISKALENLS